MPGGDVQPRLFSDDVMRALQYEISHRVGEAESGVLNNIVRTDTQALADIIGEAYRSVSGIEAPLESVPENFKMNEEGTQVRLGVDDSDLGHLVLVNTLSRAYAPTELEKAVAEQIIKGSLSQIIWDTLVRDDQPPGDSVDPTRNFYGHPASRYMEDGTVSPEALYQMSKNHGFPCSIDARIPGISLSRAKWAYALLDEEGNLPTDESAYTADPVALRQQAESSKSKMGARVTLEPTLCLWDPHITLKEGEVPPSPHSGRLNTFSTHMVADSLAKTLSYVPHEQIWEAIKSMHEDTSSWCASVWEWEGLSLAAAALTDPKTIGSVTPVRSVLLGETDVLSRIDVVVDPTPEADSTASERTVEEEDPTVVSGLIEQMKELSIV